jgi:hypothetical protein
VSNQANTYGLTSEELGLKPGETRVWAPDDFDAHVKKKLAEKQERQRQAELNRIAEIEEKKRLAPIKNNLSFNDDLANEICERVSAGELAINICAEPHMPTIRRMNQWLRDQPEFQQLYNQSVIDRLSIFEEQVIQIADDMDRDYKDVPAARGATKRVMDAEVISRAKLRVDVRFKHLKAGKPQKWGETSTLITKNEDEFNPENFSADELEKQIADIENKARIARPVK